jgi:hypothetical protein
MRTLIFALILSSFNTFTQAQTQALSRNIGEIKWQKHSTDAYSIDVLSSWEKNNSDQFGTEFIFFLATTNKDLTFRENINLLIQNLEGKNIDLNEYVSISEEQIKTMLTNAKITESIRIKGNLHESHKIIFSGDQGIYKLKFEQRYIVVKNKAYVLTYTSQESDFDNSLKDVETSLNSFTILN